VYELPPSINEHVTHLTLRWFLFTNPRIGIYGDYVTQDNDGLWIRLDDVEEDTGFQTLTIEAGEFTADNDYTYDVEISIPLSDVMVNSSEGAFVGDRVFYFGLMLPGYVQTYPSAGEYLVWYNTFGDFVATVTDAMQENVIKGEINTNFLNKKDISLDLFDIDNLNYTNGVYQNSGTLRTTAWTDDGSTTYTLVERLMKNKFQLFNTSRQVLSSDVQYIGRLRPLQLFTDSKQSNKPFVLMAYSYFPMSDKYSVKLYEYDNTTEINFI
jgi:hypothetical protein